MKACCLRSLHSLLHHNNILGVTKHRRVIWLVNGNLFMNVRDHGDLRGLPYMEIVDFGNSVFILRKRKSLIMQIMRSIFHYRLPYKGYLMNNSVAYSFYGMMWPRFSTTHFTTFTLISSKQTFSNIQLSSVRQIDWHVACCRFTAFSVYDIQYRLF